MTGVVNSTGARSGNVGTTVGTVTAAALSGALPVGVTGGSGLDALTVPSGQISNVFKFYEMNYFIDFIKN